MAALFFLQRVQFFNCTFVLNLPTTSATPEQRQLLFRLLNSTDQKEVKCRRTLKEMRQLNLHIRSAIKSKLHYYPRI